MSSGEQSIDHVLVIRHAAADYETAGNGDSGGSLNPTGRDQARGLGERLAHFDPAVLVCSQLSRAVQTAEIAASVLAIPVEVRVGLEEYDVGDERGRPYNPALFEPLLRRWRDGDLEASVPGGEDGHTVAGRVFAVLEDAVLRHSGRRVAVVSHGGAINALLGSIAPGEVDAMGGALELPPCGVVELIRSDGSWRLAPLSSTTPQVRRTGTPRTSGPPDP